MDSEATALKRVGQVSPHKRRWVMPLIALILSLTLLEIARVASATIRLNRDVQAIQTMSANGTFALTRSDQSTETDAQLTQTLQDVRDLKSSIGLLVYLGPLFGWVPRYGGDLAAAPALLDFGDQASVAAQDSLAIAQALNGKMYGAPPVPVGVAALDVAQTQSALVQNARASLAATARARARIDAAQLSPTLQDALNRFDEMLPVWTGGLDALANAPKLLGGDQPRTYLLIAQNSDELRATGGFLTGVAVVHVDHGKIAIGEFQDSYAVDDLSKPHPAPPDPLVKYLSAGELLFRDGNWSPDFPTTARQLEAIYQIDQNVSADGVIAINQRAIPGLIEAFDAITIEDPNETVDSKNVISKIYQYWAPPPGEAQDNQWWEHHKDFIGKVFQAMMPRLMAGDFKQTVFANAFANSVNAKDILIYLNDVGSGDQTSLLDGGALYHGAGDALMVVDSNLGFNKVDPNINRQATYAVTLDSAGSARATLTITYTNLSSATGAYCVHLPHYLPSYVDMQQGCYWDYVRVMAPAKSQLVSATPSLQVESDDAPDGRTAFGGYFVLSTGETKAFRFDYTLPQTPGDQSLYTLHLEKQPGAPTMPVTVRVSLPSEWHVITATPSPSHVAGNTLEFATILDRDQDIRVSIDRGLSPIVVAGGVVGLGLAGGVIFLWYRLKKRARAL